MIFYKGKHLRSSDRKYIQNAIPLFLGMLICMSCLAGGTWAWFSANRTAPVQLIRSAEYSVDVVVNNASAGTPIGVSVEENVVSCTLTPNTSYSVTLTPNGTATKGYCLITDGDKVYTTGQLLVDTTFTFTYNNGLVNQFESAQEYDKLIDNTIGKNFAIAWYWGEYPNTLRQMTFSMEEPILLENGSVIGQPIAERPAEYATLSLQLTDMTADMESGELAVDTDCVITFTADEGYTLPESISVDGVETYTYTDGVLTIPADQVQDRTEIIVTAAGVADHTESPTTEPTTEQETPPTDGDTPSEPDTTPTEGDTTPSEPTTSPTEGDSAPTEPTTSPTEGNTIPTEPTLSPTEGNTTLTEPTTSGEGDTAPADPPVNPTEEETDSPESTTAPVEEDTTPTEESATLSVDDIPTTESSGSTEPAASTPEPAEETSPDDSADTEE